MTRGDERSVDAIVEAYDNYFAREGHETAQSIRSELQASMGENCGIFRDQEKLAKQVTTIRELQERFKNVALHDKSRSCNTELMELIELGYILDFTEVIAVSALAREECRGAHWRTDFPGRNDEVWHKHTLAFRENDGSIRLDYKPVVITRFPPETRKY